LPLASPSRSSLLRSLDVSSSSLLLHELSSSSLSRAALSSTSFARFADKRAARSHLARSEGTPDGTWVGHMAQPCQENVVAIGVVADGHQSMSGVEEIQQESHSDRRTEGWPMYARACVRVSAIHCMRVSRHVSMKVSVQARSSTHVSHTCRHTCMPRTHVRRGCMKGE